jgi:LPS export ABC transporter protein LptC
MKKIIIILALLLAGAGVVKAYKSVDGVSAPNAGLKDTGQTAGESLEQKVLTFSIDGRSPKGVKQWHLEGNSAEILGEQIHLNDLTAVAYGDDVTVNLTSDRGIYRKEEGEVELIGDVHVTSDDGLKLATEQAIWSQHTKEIETDSMVFIEKDGMKAEGKGGSADSENKIARLNSDVRVSIEPDTLVNCDGALIVDSSDNTAVFHDNVMVEDKDGRLYADMLTVNFDPDTRKLTEVVAEGNVKVKKGNSYTISEKAVYTESTKSAKLLGRPRVVIDPAEVDKLDREMKTPGAGTGEERNS